MLLCLVEDVFKRLDMFSNLCEENMRVGLLVTHACRPTCHSCL